MSRELGRESLLCLLPCVCLRERRWHAADRQVLCHSRARLSAKPIQRIETEDGEADGRDEHGDQYCHEHEDDDLVARQEASRQRLDYCHKTPPRHPQSQAKATQPCICGPGPTAQPPPDPRAPSCLLFTCALASPAHRSPASPILPCALPAAG